MSYLNKPIFEVFDDICDRKLTNLEIDPFIKSSTNNFDPNKLQRLIIAFDHYILKEKYDRYIYFLFLYGDRSSFTIKDKPVDIESLNNIIETHRQKYRNSPEIIHVDLDPGIQDRFIFSPLLSEISNEKKREMFIESIVYSNAICMLPQNSLWLTKILPQIEKQLSSFEDVNDFTEGLKLFLDSPLYHFYVKLHYLYSSLVLGTENKNRHVFEPHVPYDSIIPERDYSPTQCARTYRTKNGAQKFSEKEIAFVMQFADQHEHIDNVSALIREIRNHPDCPKRIKEKTDHKAERKWIKYFDKMNNIDRK